MRTETDALLSLQRYVAAALPDFVEILTEVEHEVPERPFAVVSASGELSTSGKLDSLTASLPVVVQAYVAGTTRKEAREAAEDARDALWHAFNAGIGDGRPQLVPLYDYTGRPAVQQVQVWGSSGTWTAQLGPGGPVTVPLERLAQPLDVAAAVEDLPGVGVGNVLVFGPAGGPWAIRFDGDVRGRAFPELEIDTSQLAGPWWAPPAAAVTVLAEGAPDPWRDPRDFVRVEGLQLGGLRDPADPLLRTVTATARLTWNRGGRVPSAEMRLTGISLRATS